MLTRTSLLGEFTAWLGIALFLTSQPSAASERFMLMLDGAGVKDHRTGLVWEQAPDLEYDVWSRTVCSRFLAGKSRRAYTAGAEDKGSCTERRNPPLGAARG